MVNSDSIPFTPTENKILEAAKIVFIRHGFDGTSMQKIANEAGIHKSLLHYYFRNKETLFESVFRYAFQRFAPQMTRILNSDQPLVHKIEQIVQEYMDLLLNNPFIPAFVLREINRDPDRLIGMMQQSGLDAEALIKKLSLEMKEENATGIDPRHLMVNLISLCIFPFAARPLLIRFLFGNNQEAYSRFLQQREAVVIQCIIKSIQA